MSEEIDYLNIEKTAKIKSYLKDQKDKIIKNKDKLLLFSQFILVALIFFGLGILYAENKQENNKNIKILENKQILSNISQFETSIKNIENINKEGSKDTKNIKDKHKFLFVASKNGKTYYKISCKNRIKDKNKIYFKTEKDAQSTGLRRAKSCFK